MERIDGRERQRGTWAVGVRWEVCGREELGEIIEVRKFFSQIFICVVLMDLIRILILLLRSASDQNL